MCIIGLLARLASQLEYCGVEDLCREFVAVVIGHIHANELVALFLPLLEHYSAHLHRIADPQRPVKAGLGSDVDPRRHNILAYQCAVSDGEQPMWVGKGTKYGLFIVDLAGGCLISIIGNLPVPGCKWLLWMYGFPVHVQPFGWLTGVGEDRLILDLGQCLGHRTVQLRQQHPMLVVAVGVMPGGVLHMGNVEPIAVIGRFQEPDRSEGVA